MMLNPSQLLKAIQEENCGATLTVEHVRELVSCFACSPDVWTAFTARVNGERTVGRPLKDDELDGWSAPIRRQADATH